MGSYRNVPCITQELFSVFCECETKVSIAKFPNDRVADLVGMARDRGDLALGRLDLRSSMLAVIARSAFRKRARKLYRDARSTRGGCCRRQ